MKRFLTSFIGNVISWGLLALLAYSAWAGNEAVSKILAVAYWVIIILAIFIAFIATLAARLISREISLKKKMAAIENLRVIFKRQGVVRKTVNWLSLIAIVMLLAYTGWVFTAVIYAFSSLLSRFIISAGRDEYEKAISGLQA